MSVTDSDWRMDVRNRDKLDSEIGASALNYLLGRRPGSNLCELAEIALETLANAGSTHDATKGRTFLIQKNSRIWKHGRFIGHSEKNGDAKSTDVNFNRAIRQLGYYASHVSTAAIVSN